MNITRDQLLKAASQVGVSPETASELWQRIENSEQNKAAFKFTHIAYYFGALIVIGAMGWFMTLGWEQFGGGGIAAIAIGYAICFTIVGRRLWLQPETRIPGGLLIAVAVCMTPLAIYGLERALGFWPQGDPGVFQKFHPYIRGSWLFMELGTVAAGIVALRFFAFPFLTAPIAYALWYMSMDLTPLLFGKQAWSWKEECLVSVMFGAIVLFVAYYFDHKTTLDFSFWGYLFGTLTFWGGLSAMDSASELGKFFYFLINIAMLLTSAILGRKVFAVFGSLGIFGYLGHLAYTVFKNSMMFPFVLSLIGIGVIYFAIKYQKNQQAIDDAIRRIFGSPFKIPARG